MSVARRFLPSLSVLAAFEAAARHESVTAAAVELDLTQSAVSRQIRALEEQLGVDLFVRDRQTIRLTSAGAAYAVEIRSALQRISSASLNLRANPFGGTLNLAIPPTFGTRWLAPRLPEFLAACPGVTLNLTTRLVRFDFRFEPIDAAIYVGDESWPDSENVLLCREDVVPACSPGLRDQLDFRTAADLKKADLLHIATRPRAWERWMVAHGSDASDTAGMVFDQFATLAQAATAGLGIALVPTFLVKDEFDSGRLVRALDRPMRSAEAYYLVWPTHVPERPPLMAFRRWILEAITRDAPELA